MSIEQVNLKASTAVNRYPHLAGRIIEAWGLMSDEISGGSSEELEAERFLTELADITEGEL